MDGTRDIEETATPNDGDGFGPREAARLLAQTERDARRRFNLRPPWLTAVGGAMVLVGYGALWLSVRGQHPYQGPSLLAVVLVYAVVGVAIAIGATVYRRATAGVSGPSVRLSQRERLALMVSFLGSPVLQGALKEYGASNAIVYGVIPAAAPLIIVGTTLLGIAAIKADQPQFGAALVVVAGGVAAAFVGPSGAWLVSGIGMCIGVIYYAAATGQRLGRS